MNAIVNNKIVVSTYYSWMLVCISNFILFCTIFFNIYLQFFSLFFHISFHKCFQQQLLQQLLQQLRLEESLGMSQTYQHGIANIQVRYYILIFDGPE